MTALEPSTRWSWSPQSQKDTPVAFGDADAPLYTISVAAKLSSLHSQTLRQYDRDGIVCPQRTEGGQRSYSQRDIEKLRFVKHLVQEEGLNLAGVKWVLQLGEQLEELKVRERRATEMVKRLAERLEEKK